MVNALQINQKQLYVIDLSIAQWNFEDSRKVLAISVSEFYQSIPVQHYTCLSILLATFNYRVRGTCVPTRAFHARLAR